MDWFDLTYSTEHQTDLGIVVEALPYSRPEDLKQIELPPDEPQMEMVFRFPSLQRHLPPGIPTWSMARAHRFSKCKPWRDAAAFVDDVTKSQAVILASDIKKEVRLRVAADYPPFFFGQLRAILMDTFKRYPGAVPELLFPCPCRPGCSFSHPYETVLKRWRDNKDVYCQVSGEDVAVESLLSGARRRPETAAGRLALLSEIRRQFTAERHAKNQQMDKKCPSVFTLVPSRDFKQLDTLFESNVKEEELELALYCEHDSGWHPTPYSLYRFKPDKEWFDLLKRNWNRLVTVTKYVGPLAKAAGKASKLVALEAGGLAMEKLPEVSRSIAGILSGVLREKDWPESIDIEVRYLLERLIEHLDSKRSPTEPHNGGLQPYIIDDGRLLWLCPDHKKLYQART
jgi:internalin A